MLSKAPSCRANIYLSLDSSTEKQSSMGDVGSSCSLYSGGVDENGIQPVEVGVNHNGGSAPKVDILLPPVAYVVCCPP
jgi:hypothetical protein